ncbi:MAG: hypothetical protein DWQ07_19570 [Chloroflexi bacterium]|nr:MAG: hypothetical protein DWQ07_19570 [Chloroflexota bacterium]MBL1194282.1 hypothetical protein [Chloroflexota bacterium]NOH11572.1 hypothetical protein [Chloroflexota bacterium]
MGKGFLLKFRGYWLSAILLMLCCAPGPATAAPGASIGTARLAVQLNEVEGFSLYFSNPCLGNCGDPISYNLAVEGDTLSGGEDLSIPLSTLQTLLNSLHTLYPRTRDITHVSHTDDYPYASGSISLADGRRIVFNSSSQLNKMVPWNITVWTENEQGKREIAESYFLLHDDFHSGLSVLWNLLEGYGFPRDYQGDSLQRWSNDEEEAESIKLHLDDDEFYGALTAVHAEVFGIGEGVTEPFFDLLNQNSVLEDLFSQDYSIFDMALDVNITVNNPRPLSYRGMLALLAPNSRDVIATTVNITLEPAVQVETPLIVEQVQELLAERAGYAFLEEEVPSVLAGVIYVLETRPEKYNSYWELVTPFACPEHQSYEKLSYRVQGLIKQDVPTQLNFYRIEELSGWAVDLELYSEEAFWEEYGAAVQQNWLPQAFQQVSLDDLEVFSTNFLLKFKPDVTDRKPDLIPLLQTELPEETTIHVEHPQKEGDQTFAQLYGSVIIPEDGSEPYFVYCGQRWPSWYRDPYDFDSVDVPDPDIARDDRVPSSRTGWITIPGVGEQRINWTAFGVSQPGYVHAIWTDDDDVYYAEGLADGSAWTATQRLGPDSWNMRVVTNRRGDVHLIWSTSRPHGSVHLWRPAGGVWQEPESWEHGYFSQYILDEQGNLHLGWGASDGIDSEFFYALWTEEEGLLERENVSRQIGETGSGRLILDDQGTVHAVWRHGFEADPFVDPLSGEIFDRLGLFYAHRLGEGQWSLPEQIGFFAPFAHAMGLALTPDGQPLALWQDVDGILSSARDAAGWQDTSIMAPVPPPEEPAPFGPERWVEPTANIEIGQDADGNIYALWYARDTGVSFARFDGKQWSDPEQLTDANTEDISMVVEPNGDIHLLYIRLSDGEIMYLHYSDDEVQENTSLGFNYDYYGLPVVDLVVDEAGYVYALGLPRTPRFMVKIPEDATSQLPTPTPILSITPTPIQQTPTPTVNPVASSADSTSQLLFGMAVILSVLLVIFAWAFYVSRNEDN